MRQIIIILIFYVSLLSCRGQNLFVEERLKTADKFIECLKNNPVLARTLRILYLDHQVYQDAKLQHILHHVRQNREPDGRQRSRDCCIQ